jgi:hypothetical protein
MEIRKIGSFSHVPHFVAACNIRIIIQIIRLIDHAPYVSGLLIMCAKLGNQAISVTNFRPVLGGAGTESNAT